MPARKWCFVPLCKNTTTTTPDKIFVTVPKVKLRRRNWFAAVERCTSEVSDKSVFYCCEDHFNLVEDMENYIEYKFSRVRARMKPDVVPHIFARRPKKRHTLSSPLDDIKIEEGVVIKEEVIEREESQLINRETVVKQEVVDENSLTNPIFETVVFIKQEATDTEELPVTVSLLHDQ